MLNAHKMMYKGQILSRIYTERVEGGMGMIELDQVYKKEIIGIGEYLEGATGKFIQWVYLHEMNKPDTTSIIKKKRDYLHSHNITTNQVQGWEEKILRFRMKYLKDRYGQERKQKHLNQWKNQAMTKKYRELLEEIYIDKEKSVEIFSRDELNAEDERMIMAAQDLTLRTKWFRKHIEGENISDKCRVCDQDTESVPHILAGCQTLLNRHLYTERHNTICKLIHFKLCQKYNIRTESNNYWKQNPPEIEENEEVLLLYDCTIPTDVHVTHNRPDIVVKDKRVQRCYIIEVGVPNDNNLVAYEREKEIKYQRLKNEIRRMWDMNDIVVIPIVVGTLGVIKRSLMDHLKKLPVVINTLELSKMVIKKSLSILRLVLSFG
ncbi:UNVERIFIED_CONTAM: hypothetical protein RMT77_015359 [Armadillidium vulgare]